MPAHQLTHATQLEDQPDRQQAWAQVHVEFSDWATAADTTARHIRPVLEAAPARWWFIRKHPHWRVRYHCTSPDTATNADRRLHTLLDALVADRQLRAWYPTIYEPETRAFGGPAGMQVAHDLFCSDSRTALDLLTATSSPATSPTSSAGPVAGRIELSILAVSRMLRAARLDWFEQGDVWARVADLRYEPGTAHEPFPAVATAIHRLLTLDTSAASPLHRAGPLTPYTGWLAAFDDSGARLAALAQTGRIHRGLRAVLAHHVVFHWNRLALSRHEQLTVASLARDDLLPADMP